MRQVTYLQAITEAMHEEMARDPFVFVIGEDVDINGGVFGATAGLVEKFGARRVRGTPISESAFTGLAIGAAMTGLRPIIEFMYFDFVGVAMDQLTNQLAKLRVMSGQAVSMPVTVRAQAGVGTREAAHHSNSLEAWFVHTPGLKVVMPATAADAKGLLKSAVRDDSPVLFIENRMLYFKKEDVPDGEYTVPIGKASVVREGKDVTVIALGCCRRKALGAAEKLKGRVDVEVIDPRSLQPLDMGTILCSVGKTGRVLVVHEAVTRGGVGAEIVRRIVAEGFDSLDAEPRVLGASDVPVPFSPVLEDACIPNEESIAAAIQQMI